MSAVGLPFVILHVAVTLDGATTGFVPDVARFYALARTWDEDLTLTGADTVLAQAEALASAAAPGPTPGAPLLAVVDARARVRTWSALRNCGYWSDVVALRSARTPPTGGDVVELVAGQERVDLRTALAALAGERGIKTVRVDSGGALNGALLAAGLVREISLLVHPCLGGERRWYGTGSGDTLTLERHAAEPLDGGLVWLRYRVA